VSIKISIEKGQLFLNVTNSIPEKKREVISTKIGLKNTKERLELLYPETYKLDISDDGKTFKVDLKLPLKKIAT